VGVEPSPMTVETAASPKHTYFPIGSRVRLGGLLQRADLNGKSDVVIKNQSSASTKCSPSQSAAAVGAWFWASQGHQRSRAVQE
jgi:hypothetical protein